MTRAVLALARRALRNLLRRPQFLAPLVTLPTAMLAVNVGGLSSTTQLSGFARGVPFFDFQLAAAITQSLLLGGVGSGIAVALEIEGGFFDRLLSAPVPRLAIVLGRLLATAVIALAQVTYFLLLGLVFGAHIRGGWTGVLVVLVIGSLAGTGFGALGLMLALRARSASTVQGIFPLVFVVLFVSSAFFPRGLLRTPARQIAAYNPLSYLADGIRAPIIHPLVFGPVLDGLLAACVILVVAVGLSVLALRGRLRDA